MSSSGLSPSWEKLLLLLRQESSTDRDLRVHCSKIAMTKQGDLLVEGEKIPLTPEPEGSILRLLGLPTSFIQKCPPELRAGQVNYWLGQWGATLGSLLIRIRRGQIRAILSEKFDPLDHLDVLPSLAEMLPQAEVVTRIYDELCLVVEIHLPTRVTVHGEEYVLGLHYLNSETGGRKFRLALQINRPSAATMATATARGVIFSADHRLAANRLPSLRERTLTAIRRIPDRLEDYGSAILQSRSQLVDVELVLRGIANYLYLSRGDTVKLFQFYELDPHPSEWGISQVISRYSQLNSVRRSPYYREFCEEIAGSIIFEGLNRTWDRVKKKELVQLSRSSPEESRTGQ